MSAVEDLSPLAEHLGRFGAVAYLVTVGPDGTPHVVSVRPKLEDRHLVAGGGQRTVANVAERPSVTLLWPAPPGTGYSLVLDAEAQAQPSNGGTVLEIRPTAAVLHRTPEGDPAIPSCVTILPRARASGGR
jgi:hypothetical protein